MHMTLTVTYEQGDPDHVTVKQVDFIRFERKFNLPISAISDRLREDPDTGRQVPSDDFRLEWIWSLAYWATQRKRDVPEFDDWAEGVESIAFDPKAEADVPLAPSQSTQS